MTYIRQCAFRELPLKDVMTGSEVAIILDPTDLSCPF